MQEGPVISSEKDCESCGEPVPAAAIKCYHCKGFLDGASRPVRHESGRLAAFAAGVPCAGCGVEISSRARKCRHCKAWVETDPAPEVTGHRGLLLFGAAALIACLALGAAGLNRLLPQVYAIYLDDKATVGGQPGADYFGRAAKQWERAGEYGEQATSLDAQAGFLWDGDGDGVRSSWGDVAEIYGEAAEAHRRSGNPAGSASSLSFRAWCLWQDGRHDESIACYWQVAAAYERLGDLSEHAGTLTTLADLLDPHDEADRKAWTRTQAAFGLALQAHRDNADLAGEGYCLFRLGELALRGHPVSREDAAALFEKAGDVYAAAGSPDEAADARARQAECLDGTIQPR